MIHATQLEACMSRKGFTLIELLIVVVIIGILAAIAIPKFANTKEKAVVASMKSDLRNLVTAQEAFFSDNNDYGAGTYKGDGTVYNQLNGLAGAGRLAFTPSANNTVVLVYIDAAGWSATATNPAVISTASDVCGVYTGVAANSPNAAVKAEGAPACY
jgi:prepilin-type N-terminal cleavage/methylation domain-containing protein